MISKDSTRLVITTSKETKKQLEARAEKESRSVSSLVNKIIKDYLEGK